MTEQETDAMLRRVLLDALALEWGDLPDEPVAVSKRHARQMRAMCRDPLKWSRAHVRPVWQRVLRAAAMLALICALTLAAVLTISPTARARVKQWFAERRERDIVYSYTGDQLESEMPHYTLDPPDGYVLDNVFETPGYVLYSYRCTAGEFEGQYLYFDYLYMQEGAATSIVGTEAKIIEVSVNGHPGTLYLSHDPAQISSNLIWFDEENNLRFTLAGFFTQEELLKLARSIALER